MIGTVVFKKHACQDWQRQAEELMRQTSQLDMLTLAHPEIVQHPAAGNSTVCEFEPAPAAAHKVRGEAKNRVARWKSLTLQNACHLCR